MTEPTGNDPPLAGPPTSAGLGGYIDRTLRVSGVRLRHLGEGRDDCRREHRLSGREARGELGGRAGADDCARECS